ncbi:hypothetical protein FGRMN_4742 [Fusarium graminum]|nr:hypothetical protein FGRMN_4742 [Fusarium graminum]
MSKRYRQLLPVPLHENPPPNSQPSASSGDEPLKRQRIGTQLACNSCRKRKIRCNGRKPLCEACWRRGEKEPCIYVENKIPGQTSKETEQILELFDIMKTRPEAQAIDVLRILRCHNDLDTTMSMIQPRIAHVAIEQEQTSKHTRFLGLESELMARHSLAFPVLQPLESNILKKLFNLSRSSTVDNDNDTPMLNESPNPFPAYNPTRSPGPALRFCDERLAKLNIGHWSSVPIPSNLAAKIISLYLETDHPLLGPFDPTLFVDDLVHCRTRYCSELLVSALMYWGCQMYTSIDSSAKEFTQQFCEEAEKRWSLEKSTDSLLTLAATQLLGFSYMGNGKDHYVLTYVSEVNSMGTRMGLFGVETSVAISKAKQVSPELQSATSHTAWGTFNWIVLMALFYQQPGLTYPEHPPVLPIPGHVWHNTPDDSPESIQQALLQTYMGDTFPILCRFWRIMHETANAILGDKKDTAWRFYLYFCVQTYGDLRRSFTFAETTGRSLLSMALDQGDLSADEARKLMGQFEENRLSGPTEDIRATFMADLNLAMTDPGTASVESLSDRFEDIALFREFTNGGDSGEDEPMESDDNAWDTLLEA